MANKTFWVRGEHSATQTANTTESNLEVFHANDTPKQNYVGLQLFLCAMCGDDTDFWVARFIIQHESIATGSILDNQPEDDDERVWCVLPFARGPAYFDIRSKREIKADEKLWLQFHKPLGGVSSTAYGYYQILMTPKG